MTTVDRYIETAPEELHETLTELRTMIRKHLPHASEQIGSSGFPVYTVDQQWTAGFAWRKKGPMLYIMASGVLDRHGERLGTLRSGKSCIEWKPARHISLDELRQLADTMLAEAAARP